MDSRFIDVKVNGNSMWPTLRDGDIARFEKIDSKLIEPNLIVLFKHPFKKDFNLIKRISTIEGGEVFLVGDNPDPNASEDSHNFGLIDIEDIIAVLIK
ncbi:S26 family signal peptidase [Euryarchaeota archaeon]|jgi:nickel-type superoxide dismutase maturation protease|nr:S26 family signal peptidase [Euryarchaeota archaeon]